MDSTSSPIREGDSARLVEVLARSGAMPGFQVRRFVALPTVPGHERLITADQTHTSVVVGECLVVKWIRPLAPGLPPSQAPDTLAHLAANGFAHMPTPYAAIYREHATAAVSSATATHGYPGGELVALVTEYLPAARDGWDWCVETLIESLTDGAPADFPARIGELTAHLHGALARPSMIYSDPVAVVRPADLVPDGVAVLAAALDAFDDDADTQWLTAHAAILRSEIELAGQVARATAIHCHGDLHVGQILRWRDGYAFIDFDGSPVHAAPTMQAPTRDIAQLRTSVAHVGQIADRRTEGRYTRAIAQWWRRGVDELLDAYLAGLAAQGMSNLYEPQLLRAFEVEQECRELLYAARFLPRWRYAPMGVLRSWYE